MNKRQGTLFNFGVKKSRIEGVCDATNSDSSTSSLQSDLQDVQKEGKTTSTQKKKSAFTRKYMDSYLKFGFIQCPDTDQLPRPQCVICATVLGNEAMKPSRLTRHLNTNHSDLVNKPIEFFMRKRDALKIEKKIISQASTTDTSLLTASYLISLQIAKCKKPYSIGEELIKPSLIAACNEVLGQSAASKMKDIPLSNDTVERRISDMAEDTETQLIEKIKKSKLFALQLDESTDIQNNSILLTYVRYIDHDESDMKEDILSVSELPTHTTSSEIFKVLNGFIEERGLEWKNCVGVCTDGAACLTGRNSGLVTKIKDMAGNNLLSTHCYIHRQNLASKKLAPELNEVLSQSVKIVNYIKNSALNTRLLRALCDEMGSDHQNLIFHSEVRWLSRGKVLKRLYELRKEVALFLIDKKSDLSHYFQDKKWVARLAYLSDIFSYINELNLKLQGPDTTIFNAWNKIESFKKKLKLWLNMIAEKNNEMFQSYSDYIMEADDFYLQNSVSDIIAAHLKMLLLSFEKYYPENEDPRRQNMWIVNPFVEHKETALSHEETLQLIELSSDKGLESTFNSTSNSIFWIRMKNEYPNLHEIAVRFLLCFSTTYLCETAFSAMTVLKMKQRNRLQLSDCLRVAITSIHPRINKLTDRKQQQKSH